MDAENKQRVHSFLSQISDSLLAEHDDNPYYNIQEWIVNICANYYHANTHVIDSKILSNDHIHLFCELIHKHETFKNPNFLKLSTDDEVGWFPLTKHEERVIVISTTTNVIFVAHATIASFTKSVFLLDPSKEEQAKLNHNMMNVEFQGCIHPITDYEIFLLPKCKPFSKPLFCKHFINPNSDNYVYSYFHARVSDAFDKRIHKVQWIHCFVVLKQNRIFIASKHYSQKMLYSMFLHKKTKVSKHSECVLEIENEKRYQFKMHLCAATPAQCKQWGKLIRKASKFKITDVYSFDSELSSSQNKYIEVWTAHHRTTNKEFVISKLRKRLCEDKKVQLTMRTFLRHSDCPYIVNIFDLIIPQRYCYVVTEKCKGGKLFDQIKRLKDESAYAEDVIVSILHQIAKAVKYYHECSIVLVNLQAKDILCVEQRNIRKIKIAKIELEKMTTKDGNIKAIESKFTAPEILKKEQGYDHCVDYYSIGAIMKMMICGHPLKNGFDDDWNHVSTKMQNLCEGLMHNDPAQRKTCDDILKMSGDKSSYFRAIRCMGYKTKVLTRARVRRPALTSLGDLM